MINKRYPRRGTIVRPIRFIGWSEEWHDEKRGNLVERTFYLFFIPVYWDIGYHSTWMYD